MDKRNDLITIGLPTYNTPTPLFDIVLHQILNQTYSNFDLLIVDDGSSPNFVNHLKEIENTDKRIRIIFKKENTGIYDTRNIILKNIKGMFLTFIDSDDVIPLNYLEMMMSEYSALDNHNDTMVCCGYVTFIDEVPSFKFTDDCRIYDNNILENALVGKIGHSIWGKLFPSDLIEGINIQVENGFDDAQLVPLLCERVKRVCVTQKTVYYYRQMSGSIMHTNNFTLYQAYRTYSNYLDIAKANRFECVTYLEILLQMQAFKLCCVDYGEEFQKKNIVQYS